MPINDFIIRTLNLKDANVLSIDYVYKDNHNYYMITLVSRGNYCPRCHTFSKKTHNYEKRYLNHAFLFKDNCSIIYRQRRYICPVCGKTFMEMNPFISSHPELIQKTVDNILALLKDYNETYSSVSRKTSQEGRRINNGPIEGRNKYVKILLALANGYRNFKRFRNRILYVFNKHELPYNTPKDTRLIELPGKQRGKYKKSK